MIANIKSYYLIFVPVNSKNLTAGTLLLKDRIASRSEKIFRLIKDHNGSEKIYAESSSNPSGREFNLKSLQVVRPYIVDIYNTIRPNEKLIFFGSKGLELHTMLDDAGYGLRTKTVINEGNLILSWSKCRKVLLEPNEIGWVRHISQNSPFISKFNEVPIKFLQKVISLDKNEVFLEMNEKNELKKIQGKAILKLKQ